ncbi:MAG: uracil-DNA glycosylase [Armatimonadetes bacterium 13_1_40CM_64_14]|nr:MAG: uracil-DNA glycosylase [Armatimonadetes bacterium 13_1_40CM_64_14]
MASALAQLTATVIACRKCPRLVRYREQVARVKKREFSDWEYWGRPLPGLGDPEAELLVLGLAPAAHGGNRTGRMFTGDSSGRWLMRALYRAGFASQPTSERRDDGLTLRNAYITAAVRCAPPDNRPTQRELAACSGYLRQELTLLRRVRVVVALGQIAFAAFLRLAQESGVALPHPRPKFRHGASYRLGTPPMPLVIIASYHPSRQNTQTGRLTEGMLDHIFQLARQHLEPDRSRA